MRTRAPLAAAVISLLALAGAAARLDAQAPPAAQAQTGAARLETARVVVDGVSLYYVAGIRAYPAARRARDIAERIRTLAEDASFDPASLRIEETADSSDIVAGTLVVASVVDADGDIEGIARPLLAKVVVARIGEAVTAYRYDRRSDVLLRRTASVAGLAVVLALGFWGTHWLVVRVSRTIERRFGTRVGDVRIQSLSLVRGEQLWRSFGALLRAAWALGAVTALFFYVEYALEQFAWTRGLGLSLWQAALRPLRVLGTGLIASLPDLIFIAVLVLITRYLLKLVRLFFDSIADGRVVFSGFDAEWAQPTYRLVRIAVIAFAAVVAFPYIPGSSSEAFKGVSLFIGVIFSLGSSSIIGNMLAGLSMTYRRAFRQGDRVKIGQHVGDVEQIRMLVTHLRTPKNEEIVVPNSVILGAEVVNYTAKASSLGLILHTTVGIGYETPWRQVEAMLLEAAVRVPGLLKDPAPFVLQTGLGDFCVTYEVNVYCDQPKAMTRLYSALHASILDVFNEYGVQIMTPAYEADTPDPKIVPKSQWYAAPAKAPDASDPSR